MLQKKKKKNHLQKLPKNLSFCQPESIVRENCFRGGVSDA